MRLPPPVLAASALLAGAMFAAAPAQAVTIVPLSATPLSLPAHPSVVIPKGTFVQKTNVYDFTFSTIGHPYDALMQMQSTNVKTGKPVALAFELFRGLPGSGHFVADSGGTASAATILDELQPGSYFLELSTVQAPKELVTGGVTLLSVAPEPATWASMLLGLGLLGGAMRRRRQPAAVIAN